MNLKKPAFWIQTVLIFLAILYASPFDFVQNKQSYEDIGFVYFWWLLLLVSTVIMIVYYFLEKDQEEVKPKKIVFD